MPLSRRDFLKLSAGAAASIPLSRFWIPSGDALAAAQAKTTLDTTIVKGALWKSGTKGAYYRLTTGPGEPHIQRGELGGQSSAPITTALTFVHFTDIHIVDAQSPARVEFLDRYNDLVCNGTPLDASQRPQETMSIQVLESMIRRVRAIQRGPVTGQPFSFVVCTGDNVDNEQLNELRWFIDTMDGGKTITPNSGGPTYEGVQSALWADQEYWHPDRGVTDKYKREFGFPNYPGLLSDAIKPFKATGIGLPWWQTYGNHDGLMQGNVFRNVAFNLIAVGSLKVVGLPPGADPCNPFLAFPDGPARPVTPDPKRQTFRRGDYIAAHFNTTGTPVGHGFTDQNRQSGLAYYVRDDHPPFRFISIDTVNPGGYLDGSIGAAQFAWLEQRLIEVSGSYYDADGHQVTTDNEDRLVVLFSHHGLRSLNNPVITPNLDDPGSNDLPRVMADEIEALVHRFPNVIAWFDGHTHNNIIDPRPDPTGRTNGFWDVGTAAHVDWICQTRIVELAVRADGNISIFCTMVNHNAPADPRGATGVMRLAAIHRELAANDPQYGFNGKGPGAPEDRNVELTVPGPPWISPVAAQAARRVRQPA
ncbi:MAG TPA: TIGR03767 family metallophosphoesterase [Actinomycetota bacterium]|nr:TIGR03767 family metallophosphoesterase [Actinomycetota bacterium]